MAIDAAERFLITEVAKSTGLSYATVQGRMVTLGILETQKRWRRNDYRIL